MWDTAIAVAGTLLGVVVTHLLQYRATDRREHRKAILDTATDTADALTHVRRLQETRWASRGSGYPAAKQAVWEARSTAGPVLFRFKALVRDEATLALLDELVDLTFNLHDAPDADELDRRYSQARQLNDRLARAIGRLTH
ncbi:hypothetical protein ACIBCO_37275 [Streptomyces violascens]|uniref:hypothetical protein n=1 Tax=Streptomyces violascens TaxID=67381 RepID=UPI0037AE8B25